MLLFLLLDIQNGAHKHMHSIDLLTHINKNYNINTCVKSVITSLRSNTEKKFKYIISLGQLSQTLLYQKLSITNVNTQVCTNQVQHEVPMSFCIKALQLSSKVQNFNISMQSGTVLFHSLYTNIANDLVLDLSVTTNNLPSFALFGITKLIWILNSQIQVKMSDSVSKAALICFNCDINASASDLLFVASGFNVSGVVETVFDNLRMEKCLIQYRLEGGILGGLVMFAQKMQLSLSSCNISGYFMSGNIKGAIISVALDFVQVQTLQTLLCVNIPDNTGQGANLVTFNIQITQNCNLCQNNFYVYGLCESQLKFGQIVGKTIVCAPTFVFNGQQCACGNDDLINGTTCVNLIQISSQLLSQDISLQSQITQLRSDIQTSQSANITSLKQQLQNLNESLLINTRNIYSNISATNKTIIDLEKIVNQLQITVSNLQNQIQLIDQKITGNSTTLNTRINILNTSVIDNIKKVYDNITAVNTTVSQIQSNLNNNMVTINTKLTSLDTYLLSNISAVNASILSLKTITISNMTQINATLLSTTSQIQNNISAINTTLQSINNSLLNNILQVNGSLTTLNATLFSNISAINQTIQYVNNSLLLNISNVNSSMLQKTSNLLQNITDINSTLTNRLTQSNLIVDRQYSLILDIQNQVIDVNQADLDPQFDFQDDFSIDLVCAQQVFTKSFDITTVTSSIQQSNFTGAFVFDTIINNSFIDVQDSALPSTYFYIFKTQSYYYNLKIQFGTETLNSGSLIADTSVKMVNKVSIINKAGSTLSISSSNTLNILCKSCQATNVRNLFVNLVFASVSTGSINLINTLTGFLNIRNYQVSGTYYSSQTSCLGVLFVNNASVSVQFLNFNPIVITLGNFSSYLFSQVNYSTLQLQKIVLQVGVSDSNSNIITTISTTNTTNLVFGGIITTMNQSNIDFKISTFSIFFTYNTMFINNSGQILGLINKASIISISQICFQESIKLQTSATVILGIIGYAEGILSISRSQIQLSVTGNAIIPSFGTIAIASPLCTKQLFSYLTLQVYLGDLSTGGQIISALVGSQLGLNWTVQNTVFRNLLMQSGTEIGAISGFCKNSFGTAQNILLEDSMISSERQYIVSFQGGFCGYISSSNLNFQHTSINNSIIQSKYSNTSHVGFSIGIIQNSEIFINIIVFNSNLYANSSHYDSVSGLVARSIISNLTISDTNFQETEIITMSLFGGDSFTGYIIGDLQQSNMYCTNIIVQSSSVQTYSLGDAHISILIARAVNNSQINLQSSSIMNTFIKSKNIKIEKLFSSGIISILNSSQLILQDIQIQSVNMSCEGNVGAQGGLVGLIHNAFLSVKQFSAFNIYSYLNTKTQNASLGGAIGIMINSQATLQECSIKLMNLICLGEYSIVGGFLGLINSSSTVYQSDSRITSSVIYGQSSNETNVGGFFGVEQSSSNISFDNCEVSDTRVNSSSITSRSVLFGSRIENAKCEVNRITIINSTGTTAASTPQSRVGGLFGRVYYSSITAVQVNMQNVDLSSHSTLHDSSVGAISTSLANSSFIFSQSIIKSISMKSSAENNNYVTVAIFFPTHTKTEVIITDVIVEQILINCSAASVHISVVSAYMWNDGLNRNVIQLTHFLINSIQIVYQSSTQQYIGLVDGRNERRTTDYLLSDSKSIGLYTINGVQFQNCDPLTYFVDSYGKYTTRRGC
ncbi:Hypothetical_protein [Hexamita inflata]|uniref:Hypothetical_protein n=1 Tax=Hexamita inflata TaxID=28002 RepID=A0ABP1HZ44_9EUKA